MLNPYKQQLIIYNKDDLETKIRIKRKKNLDKSGTSSRCLKKINNLNLTCFDQPKIFINVEYCGIVTLKNFQGRHRKQNPIILSLISEIVLLL